MSTTGVFTTRKMPAVEMAGIPSRRLYGWLLVVASFAMYAGIALLPMTSLSTSVATLIAGVLVILGEGTFVAGMAMVGPELWTALKGWWARLGR